MRRAVAAAAERKATVGVCGEGCPPPLRGPHKITHRLMSRVRRPNSCQLAGAMQSRQRDRVASVRLDALARPFRMIPTACFSSGRMGFRARGSTNWRTKSVGLAACSANIDRIGDEGAIHRVFCPRYKVCLLSRQVKTTQSQLAQRTPSTADRFLAQSGSSSALLMSPLW